jgi:hypothetical protein
MNVHPDSTDEDACDAQIKAMHDDDLDDLIPWWMICIFAILYIPAWIWDIIFSKHRSISNAKD